MARNKGTFNFAANFEVLTKAPLDARLVVDTKANLIDHTIWEDGSFNVWLYKGITVSVVSDPSTENNGLYFLTDETNYTDYNYWVKLNTTEGIDASGTASVTWQLNNGNNGIMLKDASGNLEVVAFDGSTYANIKAGHLDINTIKIDTLNGALYAVDGSIYASSGTYPLKAYDASIFGNDVTASFTIDHSLNTLKQSITVYDNNNDIIYPELERGLNTNRITFIEPPTGGVNYEIIILGF